jgi:two-component system response regulator YesN
MNTQGLLFNLGVGNSYSNLSHLNLSYVEAQIALRNISTSSNINFIFYDQLNNTDTLTLLDQKTQNHIKGLMINNKVEPLNLYLKEIFRTFVGKKSFDQIMLLSVQLISIPFELLSSLSDSPISFYKETESILTRFTGLGNLDGIEDEILDIYGTYFTQVKELPTTSDKISDQIANYIEANYYKPNLGIPLIADHLHLNYSYLCTCFKQDRGITIIEYLNEIRIQNAVKLFDQGVINVTYVSEKCGYLTPAYFSKRFKKVTGLIPSDYIKVIANKMNSLE